MKKVLLPLLPLLSLTALTASARSFDVKLWRGETTAVQMPDYAEIGKVPEGLKVRIGAMMPVNYQEKNDPRHVLTCLDRVDFTQDGGTRYVEVTAAPDAKPGAYAVGNMRVTVVDRVLPPVKEWKYYLDLWQHPWAVARYFKVAPFSRQHYAKMRPLWELLADAGQKVLTTTLLDEPWDHQCRDAYHSMVRRTKVEGKGGGGEGVEWKFDYSVFDEYVEFGRSCGIGPHVACYTMCPWGYLVSWEDEKGELHKREAKPGTPFFEEYWGPFLVDFAKHLKERGWFADTYIAMDERSPADVRNICALIQAKAPGMKVSMAGNRKPSDFKGIVIDNYSQHMGIGVSEDDAFREEICRRRAEGKLTLRYVCCSPAWPNTFMHSPVSEAYWLGAYPALGEIDGFLRWAYNSWPNDPMKDATFNSWSPGDTFLVYPDGSPSVRFLELRNGIVAAEKFRILREAKVIDDAKFAELVKVFDMKKALGSYDFTGAKSMMQTAVNR